MRTGLIGLLLLILAGCSFWGDDDEDQERCVSAEEYQAARTAREITVPEGLSRPDESGKLYVPSAPQPAEPLEKTVGCLPEAPDYFEKPHTDK